MYHPSSQVLGSQIPLILTLGGGEGSAAGNTGIRAGSPTKPGNPASGAGADAAAATA
eukprot:CAMPEP_0173253568 /NCGR_PEP_ID=MMETSP1142-20121109/21401_1 /TAXON_ID=483371 /ORGANISM="non described non described, Strain CCMP2298" /LENGTH=56 /DNA_ID=CAMNT_0014186829 /DNA_START=52 /DNA_END=220 /DNA_ORIENTATION=-